MEREKHSYQNQVVQVSRKIFTSINAADEALICGFVTSMLDMFGDRQVK
jgi:lipoprotein signal peptidase